MPEWVRVVLGLLPEFCFRGGNQFWTGHGSCVWCRFGISKVSQRQPVGDCVAAAVRVSQVPNHPGVAGQVPYNYLGNPRRQLVVSLGHPNDSVLRNRDFLP